MMARVRGAAISEMIAKLVRLDRSGGISVVSTHLPTPYRNQSSPGATEVSMPATLKPNVPTCGCGFGGAAGGGAGAASATGGGGAAGVAQAVSRTAADAAANQRSRIGMQ